jgi:pimeloyl-ACP methyl ester carboxylesterase
LYRTKDQLSSPEGISNDVLVEDLSADVDGLRVRFVRSGSGPALVLVHGLLGYSYSWRHTISGLAQNSTVYALDLPGAGYSNGSPEMDCGMRACAERLLRFMDAVGIRDCDLLGTSHGGAVAMMAASIAPKRVRNLILVDPVNPWSAHGRLLSVLLSNPVVAPIFCKYVPSFELLHDLYFRRMYGDTRRIRPGTLEGYMKPLYRPGALEYGLSILRSWNRDLKELGSIFPRISHLRTLIVWGSLDTAVDPASAAKLKPQFQNSELVIMEGVGHLPYEEVPEQFVKVVSGFLRRQD